MSSKYELNNEGNRLYLNPSIASKLPFIERQKQWVMAKEEKIQTKRDENKDSDIKGLTFKPIVVQTISL